MWSQLYLCLERSQLLGSKKGTEGRPDHDPQALVGRQPDGITPVNHNLGRASPAYFLVKSLSVLGINAGTSLFKPSPELTTNGYILSLFTTERHCEHREVKKRFSVGLLQSRLDSVGNLDKCSKPASTGSHWRYSI